MEVSQPQTVHIVRGPSGCGKTTFAKQLSEDIFASKILAYGPPHLRPKIISADDFFTNNDGEYVFDPRLLSRAHTETITNAMSALKMGRDVIIANTFTNYWEVSPYIWMAQLAGASCIVYEPDVLEELKDGTWAGLDILYLKEMHARCTHGVPIEQLKTMWPTSIVWKKVN